MEENNVQYRMPLIGDAAPEFSAKTTQGQINFPADYKGKWVILFSHPADFTPVCTTEFMTFAYMQEDFRKLNTELVGLSIDSIYAHIAWLRTIKEKIEYKNMKNIEVNFPVIEDISMDVAKKIRYGSAKCFCDTGRKGCFCNRSQGNCKGSNILSPLKWKEHG